MKIYCIARFEKHTWQQEGATNWHTTKAGAIAEAIKAKFIDSEEVIGLDGTVEVLERDLITD